jgi:hypothetical protein
VLCAQDLLDRYDQHARHCTSCSGALKNIRKLRPVMLAIAAVSGTVLGNVLTALTGGMESSSSADDAGALTWYGVLSYLWTAGRYSAWCRGLSYGLLGLSVLAHHVLGRFESAITTGPYPPPRNRRS